MIFDSRLEINTPESIILSILATKPRISTKELYDFYCKKEKSPMTIQGFYKLLRQMLKSRIILKESNLLLLDSFWISKVVDFADLIKENYLDSKVSSASILLEEGENKKYEFENIAEMDNFWGHGLNVVKDFYTKNEHSDKNAYSQHYFSVFHLARTKSEQDAIQTFGSVNMQWYMASGSNTFLNKLVPKIIERENHHQFIYDFEEYNKNRELPLEKNLWVTLIGDFIFEATFPKYIFELIEKIYEETRSIGEFNADKLNSLFQEPGKTFLTVSRDKKKAEKIRNEIKNLYEISLGK